MANIDYAGLLTGISSQNQRPSPFTSPSRDQQLLGFAAKQNEALTGRLGGMFGQQQQDPVELAKTKLVGLDPTNPADQAQFIQLLNIVDPAKAAQFKQQLEAKKLASKEREDQKVRQAAADKKADLLNLGGGSLYKVSTGEFLNAPGAEAAAAAKDAPKPLPEAAQNSLIARAESLGITPENKVDLQTALKTGLVTDIKGIEDFVQAPVEYNYTKEVSVAIKDANKAFTKGSQGARQAEGIITNILSSNALEAAGGLRANISEGFKEIIGGRDLLSTLRTQATQVINTEVVNNLPPGVASDRDIAIFSKGFPNPDTATFQELQEYLEASKRINQSLADYGQFKNQYIDKNMSETGYARLEGFIPQQRKFNNAKNFLDGQLGSADMTKEAADKLLNDFEEAFGMIPQEYM